MKQALQSIIRQAGEMILRAEDFRVEQKEGHANFVTNVDEDVQRFLIGALKKLLPDSRIIGEEQENEALTDEPTWVIDPLDGTTNFIHDYRFSVHLPHPVPAPVISFISSKVRAPLTIAILMSL